MEQSIDDQIKNIKATIRNFQEEIDDSEIEIVENTARKEKYLHELLELQRKKVGIL